MLIPTKSVTPIQKIGRVYVKRDDLWNEQGVAYGGKARQAGVICRYALANGFAAVCVCLDRNSSVPGMLSRVCAHYKIHLRVWHPTGALSPQFLEAASNGAVLTPVSPGYMSVRRARAKQWSISNRGMLLDVGLQYATGGTFLGQSEVAFQTHNIPDGARLVCAVGSGGTLRGIIAGLSLREFRGTLVGVCVGNQPAIQLPPWARLVRSSVPFGKYVAANCAGLLPLDPAYEAKAFEFLNDGDYLWIVAHRDTE